ncbi:hypothetical protein GCK72_008567 [Caenorhabditis remanei]|uniref:F-box domain-containing protein n=1 Tax=Caenorhabditis remanei TaxID=31234 RepID=A0A6A5H032_CAERE|nr:hypothetical protein GCK72_008567 [Caenorhabditis remanei]KAF1760319.1 hypothetical protein GCK72_008567 [Caenorhabditis remanei]
MVSTFSLFRLPENAIIHVLQNMEINQLLIISLISSKTKQIVTSLGIEARYVGINIYRCIWVTVSIDKNHLNLTFYNDSNNLHELSPVDITLPVSAHSEDQGIRIPSSTAFNFSNWLNHIKTVFCWIKPPNVYFSQGCERFEVQSLKNAIGNVDALSVSNQLTNILSREVLKYFKTPKKLTIGKNPFEETCEIQTLFVQNFRTIAFHEVYSLDDMLSLNCKKAHFTHLISQKQFNQFVKHWIRGSNRRLQYMTLSIDATDFANGKVYLNGIETMKMRKIEKKEIRRAHRILIRKMIRIRRKDGTPAVIGTVKRENILYVHFIVLY